MSSLQLWPIGNCQVSGLIDESASLVWGCIPRVDGDPTFCALLRGENAGENADQNSGAWRLQLVDQVSARQHYLRNTPILVQLLWVYYVLPIVFDVGISAFTALVIGLSLYSSAFIAEVYRAGIQAVPIGHREAAQVLGLNKVQTFRRIILPQAIRMTLPPLAANFVQLIKYSSLGAVISVSEITRRGMELSSSTFRPLEIFTFIAVVYFFICWPLTMSVRYLERRMARR